VGAHHAAGQPHRAVTPAADTAQQLVIGNLRWRGVVRIHQPRHRGRRLDLRNGVTHRIYASVICGKACLSLLSSVTICRKILLFTAKVATGGCTSAGSRRMGTLAWKNSNTALIQ